MMGGLKFCLLASVYLIVISYIMTKITSPVLTSLLAVFSGSNFWHTILRTSTDGRISAIDITSIAELALVDLLIMSFGAFSLIRARRILQ